LNEQLALKSIVKESEWIIKGSEQSVKQKEREKTQQVKKRKDYKEW